MTYSQGYPSPAGVAANARLMTDAERQLVKAVPRPQRLNAVGISIVAMAMAVMVNFVEDQFAIVMPVFFSLVGLGLALQARKASGVSAAAVAKGTVMDVRGTPRFKGAGGWEFGTMTISKSSQLDGALVEGVPATVSVVPEAKRLLSVNGVTLRKPVAVTVPPGFEAQVPLAAPAPYVPHVQPVDEDVPPPPDGYVPRSCPKCGRAVSDGVMFCEQCGFRLRP